jgi:hypothetical protein
MNFLTRIFGGNKKLSPTQEDNVKSTDTSLPGGEELAAAILIMAKSSKMLISANTPTNGRKAMQEVSRLLDTIRVDKAPAVKAMAKMVADTCRNSSAYPDDKVVGGCHRAADILCNMGTDLAELHKKHFG